MNFILGLIALLAFFGSLICSLIWLFMLGSRTQKVRGLEFQTWMFLSVIFAVIATILFKILPETALG